MTVPSAVILHVVAVVSDDGCVTRATNDSSRSTMCSHSSKRKIICNQFAFVLLKGSDRSTFVVRSKGLSVVVANVFFHLTMESLEENFKHKITDDASAASEHAFGDT